MYENSFYATVPIDTDTYLNRGPYHEDAFYLLPEEVQEPGQPEGYGAFVSFGRRAA